MKATIQADVRACDPPTLAVRVDEHALSIAQPHGQLPRVDLIARETRQLGTVEQVSLVVVHGTPSAALPAPLPIHNLSMRQEPLAWVTIGPSQWEVRQEHIHTEWPPPAREGAHDLVGWLLEQIAEDERRARAVSRAPLLNTVVVPRDWKQRAGAEHLNNWMPWRVLAECDAKRRLVELHTPENGYCPSCLESESDLYGKTYEPAPCMHLRILALPYAGRPGYREEWKPCP